ncbi:MAG TPA: hypothetical protein VGL66_14500 [Caulobacteraceae bacterium]|jgi:hypothetical protein
MTDRDIAWLEAQAEAAYTAMYEAADATTAAARYNDAKEFLTDAIVLARQSGDDATATRLDARRAHIKAVFRSQFS